MILSDSQYRYFKLFILFKAIGSPMAETYRLKLKQELKND